MTDTNLAGVVGGPVTGRGVLMVRYTLVLYRGQPAAKYTTRGSATEALLRLQEHQIGVDRQAGNTKSNAQINDQKHILFHIWYIIHRLVSASYHTPYRANKKGKNAGLRTRSLLVALQAW